MGSIGFSEIMVVLVIALVILGPDRLPEAARTVGRWYGQFKRMSNDLQGEVQGVMDEVVTPFNDAINEGMAAAGSATAVTSQAEADAHATTTSGAAVPEHSDGADEPDTPKAPPMLATPAVTTGAAALGATTSGGALAGVLGGALPSSADDVWRGLGGKPAPVTSEPAPTGIASAGIAGTDSGDTDTPDSDTPDSDTPDLGAAPVGATGAAEAAFDPSLN